MNRGIVAFLRGLFLSVLLAVVVAVIEVLASPDLPDALEKYKLWVPVVITALRTLEGLIDQAKKGNDPNGASGLPTALVAFGLPMTVIVLTTLWAGSIAVVLLL